MLDDKKIDLGHANLIAEAASSRFLVNKWKSGQLSQLEDVVAEEVPVALIYNGISHAVMLATPQDLEDFALGFSLAEGILSHPKELYAAEIVTQPTGIELRMEIATERFHQLKEKRRSMTGRTGCGLCGAESLAQALRLPETVNQIQDRFSPEAILKALANAHRHQPLQAKTGATHASFWVAADGEIDTVREDVGRHNALDKLLGAKAKVEGKSGFVLTTSRASYEMVQKVAVAGVPMLVAISAPTGLAIRMAERCGVTLVGFARPEQYVVYTHPERIKSD
jgi:FdhD protein